MAEGEASSGTSPFTDEDFQRALNEEKANSAEEGWSRLKETEHVEIWRKIEQGVDTHLIKVRVIARASTLCEQLNTGIDQNSNGKQEDLEKSCCFSCGRLVEFLRCTLPASCTGFGWR